MRKVYLKYRNKVVAVVSSAVVGITALAGSAHAAGPTLADSLVVTIEPGPVYAAMAAMILIIGGIAAYRFVKSMLRG